MSAFAFIGLGAGIVPLGLIILIIVAVTGGRNEPDPDVERPAALYYAGVMFVTIFTTLFALFTVVASLLALTVDDGYNGGSGVYSVTTGTNEAGFIDVGRQPRVLMSVNRGADDRDWANALRAAIIAAAAGGLYLFHDQRRREKTLGAVAARVKRTYLYVVSFVAVTTALIAAVMTVYAIFELIAPGVTGAGTRGKAGVHFVENGFLAAAAAALFWYHLRAAEPGSTAAIGIAPVAPPPAPVAKKAPAKKAAAKKAAAKKA